MSLSSFLRRLVRDALLLERRDVSTRKRSRRKVSATSRKREIKFNPRQAIALFISSCIRPDVFKIAFLYLVLSFISFREMSTKDSAFYKKINNCLFLYTHFIVHIIDSKRINKKNLLFPLMGAFFHSSPSRNYPNPCSHFFLSPVFFGERRARGQSVDRLGWKI